MGFGDSIVLFLTVSVVGHERSRRGTLGKFDGLGLEISSENGRIKVISAIDETPAAQAGIIGGEIIACIDDEPVDGLNPNEVAEKLRGPANTRGHLEKFLSPSRHESDSVTARGHGRMER